MILIKRLAPIDLAYLPSHDEGQIGLLRGVGQASPH